MKELEKGFNRETMSGETVTVDDVAVTPQSQAVTMHWPRAGWVWNRPIAVLVRRGEDEEERIPIVDVTRVAQLALFGFSLVFALLGMAMWILKRSKSNE